MHSLSHGFKLYKKVDTGKIRKRDVIMQMYIEILKTTSLHYLFFPFLADKLFHSNNIIGVGEINYKVCLEPRRGR